MTRKSVTARDAEAYRQLVIKRFKPWVQEGYEPVALEDWDGRGHWAIAWEDGAPYEWSYYATTGSFKYVEREPEFGFTLPIVNVPDSLGHIFSEPYSQCVVMLYLDA